MKYQKPQRKIKATEIAEIEGISYQKVRFDILNGLYGPYWLAPLRVTYENYLKKQEEERREYNRARRSPQMVGC